MESTIVSKHNVKGRLFQKKCRAVNWDSVLILILVLQFKNYLWVHSWNRTQSLNMSSLSWIFQRWWDSRVTSNRWFGFKSSNSSDCCWNIFYQYCLVHVCNWHKMCWSLKQKYRWLRWQCPIVTTVSFV